MNKSLFIFVIVSYFILSNIFAYADDKEHLNKLIRPYLDSLQIIAFNEENNTICLESLFPASRVNNPVFDDYETEGIFSSQVHRNPNLLCYVTGPIAVFNGLRISVGNALSKGGEYNYAKIDLEKKYRFVSKEEISPSGEKLIRQTLEVKTFLSQAPELGFVELEIWDDKEDVPVDIGRPVYRHALYYKGERAPGYATHLLRDADGVYSPIDFSEGSDRTFASFKGGRMGLFVFQIKYMEYPKEAIEKNLSGSVLITATITPDGKIEDISFFNQVDPVFKEEAMRLAKKTSGKWIPATRNGKNIEDQTTFSIQFEPQYMQTW